MANSLSIASMSCVVLSYSTACSFDIDYWIRLKYAILLINKLQVGTP